MGKVIVTEEGTPAIRWEPLVTKETGEPIITAEDGQPIMVGVPDEQAG